MEFSGDTASPYINNGIIFLERAEDFKSTKLPLSTFPCKYRRRSYTTVDRCGISIYELESFLEPKLNQVCLPNWHVPTAMPFNPHLTVSGARPFRFICHVKGTNRSVAMYMYVSVCKIAQHASLSRLCSSIPTSTVSKTLITPGCRRVRSLRRAFRARGRRDLFAVMSKEKTLHFEPSSCHSISQYAEYVCHRGAYSLGSIVQSPDRLVDIHLGIKGVGKSRAFRY